MKKNTSYSLQSLNWKARGGGRIKSHRRERDVVKPEPLFRWLQMPMSQLAKDNTVVSKQAATVTYCMERSQATSAQWVSRRRIHVRSFAHLLKMSAVKGKDCWGNCGSNTECLPVCCLHWCYQPELVGTAPFLALKRGNGNSQTARAAVTSCQWGTRSKWSFCFLPFAFSRTSTVNRKAQSYTNNLPYLPPGLFFRCASISPAKAIFLSVVENIFLSRR